MAVASDTPNSSPKDTVPTQMHQIRYRGECGILAPRLGDVSTTQRAVFLLGGQSLRLTKKAILSCETKAES